MRKLPPKGSPEEEALLQAYATNDMDEALRISGLSGTASLNRAMRQVYGMYRSKLSGWRSLDRPPADTELPPKFRELKTKSWEEHLAVFRQMDDLVAFHQRTPTEVTIEIDTDLPIGIVKLADFHLGMFGTDYESFERDMNLIETEPGLFCDIGGDGYQNIIQPGKMGSSHNQIPISVQKGLYVLTLKKLRHKIKTLRTGNHNYWSAMAEGEDWDAEIARKIHLVYLKHFAKIYWKIRDMVYPELAMHKGRFNSSFNLTHTCKQYQRLHFPDARIINVEHQHIAAIEQYRYNEKECVAVRTGTYAVYDDYAQQNGFFGSHVCNPLIIYYPDRDHLVGFKDMHDGITFLRAIRKEYEDTKRRER